MTAIENVRNAAAVVTRMMRATRPLSAAYRSASMATLLALVVAQGQGLSVALGRQHLRAGQHGANGEQRHGRRRIGQHAQRLHHGFGQLQADGR